MSTPQTADPALHMLRLLPDLAVLGRWAAATGQRVLRDDLGYALHAALRATLGALAPQPFALLQRPGSLQVIGYSTQAAADIQRALEMAAVSDPVAARALGLLPGQDPLIKPMPQDWRAGQRLSFEARVAPVVRSRLAGASSGGGYPEIDAAFHPAYCGECPGDRESAHRRWLAQELARGQAATLLSCRATAFQLTPIARRSGRPDAAASATTAGTSRATSSGLLPDLTVRGQMTIDNPAAFQHLLARGLGRHRSFGYGCLLLAPPGAWT